MKINLRWPATPHSAYVPWYVILWRLPWIAVATATHIVTAVMVGIAYLSIDRGYEAWKDRP